MVDLSKVIMVCKDPYIKNNIVTDKDFLIAYDLEQWQLDKMKEFGLKKGYFRFKTYDFLLYTDGELLKKIDGSDKIMLPNVKNNGRKVRFLFSDVIKAENIPPSNTYITKMKIFGETMVRSEFERRTGISESKLRVEASRAKSFKINGILVTVTRPAKTFDRYKVINTNTGYVSPSLPPNKVIKNTGFDKYKLSSLNKKGDTVKYKNYSIEKVS